MLLLLSPAAPIQNSLCCNFSAHGNNCPNKLHHHHHYHYRCSSVSSSIANGTTSERYSPKNPKLHHDSSTSTSSFTRTCLDEPSDNDGAMVSSASALASAIRNASKSPVEFMQRIESGGKNKDGLFIQHCPTNGDPTFDIKRVKPPTGIPKSMLMATPDGSYALPSGAVAVLKPNEAAFEKEIEGMPSTRFVGDLPPELHCPLCREIMKDAVLTSKCCFKSFCDKCIRNYIISKSMCVCGATNVLADDLLPNKTLRDTINRILESNNSSGENGGSVFQIQDMESARCPQPKIPSPTLSAASKGEQALPQQVPPQNEETTKIHNMTEPMKVDNPPEQTLDKLRTAKVADVSEAAHESRSMKEPASQGSAPLAEQELQQKPVSGEAGK